MTTATASRVTREILEDRIAGLLNNPVQEEEGWTEDDSALRGALIDIVSKVARVHGDDCNDIVEAVRLMVWENVVDLVDKSGLAQQ